MVGKHLPEPISGIASIEAMIAAEALLISAIEAGDLDAIEHAAAQFRDHVHQVRSVGAWDSRPELKRMAVQALALADSARHRANFMSDHFRARP